MSVFFFLFELQNQLAECYRRWHELYAIDGHPNAVLRYAYFNPLNTELNPICQ